MVADHPRVCGEYRMAGRVDDSRSGSSPRVRGILVGVVAEDRLARIIPACAGNTAAFNGVKSVVADHPRVCGEYPKRRPVVGPGARIIPACAGNTSMLRTLPLSETDHPRVCGEYPLGTVRPTSWLGSSPRVRGIPPARDDGVRPVRIIPACAGNTRRASAAMSRATDHPRVCGEYTS